MKKTLTVLFTLLVIIAPLFGAAPPDRMNFQGVLRNATDAPQNGTFDMVFEFYDAATLGNQILLDSHTGGAAVTVTGGLFSVQLGSGVVTDGTGPGAYTSLTNVMRDYSAVFVEVHVASETLSPRIQVASSGHALNAEHADLLDGLDSTAFATASHVHQLLTAGAGLGGVSYDGGTAKTFSVTYGTAADTAVQGNQTATITAGNGLTGGVSADALGDGFSTTVNVVGGNGIGVGADNLFLTSLSSNWIQSGAFDIVLNNSASELRILESGATPAFFGILDVGDLSADGTYTLSGNSGTVWTTGNDGAASTLDADLLDGLNSGNASGNIPISNGTLNTNLNADLLDGLDSTTFATASHVHQDLTAGAGLTGTTYNGGSASTFDVGAGNGISVAADTVLLGPLTADWNQTGAFDILLNNAGSELRILESAGATFLGTLDVGDLAANATYTFSGTSGTVWTSGNDGAASGLNADLLDSLDSTSFLRSNTTDNYTAGTLTLDPATTFAVNGTFRVGSDSSTDDDSIFFDDGTTESFMWNETNLRFELTSRLMSSGIDVDASIRVFTSGLQTGNIDFGGMNGLPGLLIQSSDNPSNPALDKGMQFLAYGSQYQFVSDFDGDVAGGGFEWKNNGSLSTDRIMDLDTSGNLAIDGSLTPNAGMDLAENYVAEEPVEAGDLVRAVPSGPNRVALTRSEGDAAVLGVVSTRPGVVLAAGAFSEAGLQEVWGDEVVNLYLSHKESLKAEALTRPNGIKERLKLAKSSANSETVQHLAEIDSDLDGESLRVFFEHYFAPVALAGRVPVKVDTQFGDIQVGDMLAPSPVPGVAMKATGPSLIVGTALENFSGGRGKVMMFVNRGWYAPAGGVETQTAAQNEIKKRTPDPDTGKQELPGNFQVMLDRDADDESRFSVFGDGKDGVANEVFRVDEDGNVYAKGAFRPASMDLAEYHRVSEAVEVGDVLAADRTKPGIMRKVNTAFDPAVVGIVSGKPGVLMGSGISEMAAVDSELAAQLESARSRGDRKEEARVWKQLQAKFAHTHAPIALSGTVLCKVDAGYGGIEVGNLLVASPTSGHAMRSDNPLPGTVVAKALEPLAAGAGLIRVLVMLR